MRRRAISCVIYGIFQLHHCLHRERPLFFDCWRQARIARPTRVMVVGEQSWLKVDAILNGEGLIDQLIHVQTQDLGLTANATQLCLIGGPGNGRASSSCEAVSIR